MSETIPLDIEKLAANLASPQLLHRRWEIAQELMTERAASREKVAQFMLRNSFATGHGDTIDDLLGELEEQIAAIRRGTP